jgi:ATP-dependent Lon protease
VKSPCAASSAPVGGIREKVLGAHRAGIKRVMMCEKNQKDLIEVPEVVRKELEFFFVSKIDEVLELVLEKSPFIAPPVTEAGVPEIRA